VTARAFAAVVSPEVTIGAHAMAVTEGLWDERKFLGFVAEHRLPFKFLTASFYDTSAGTFTSGKTLPQTIAHLRQAAEAVGLTNLTYGVDEGRLLYGRPGVHGQRDLNLRIVGDTYQAAYDARIVRQVFESGAEYFASWGSFSGPNTWGEGLPSVSFHVARETAAFKGMRRLPVTASGAVAAGVEAESHAALAPDGSSLRVMAYAFTNHVAAAGTCRLKFSVRLPEAWKGRNLTVVRKQVDDDANWFDEWRKDRARLGIGDDAFVWSGDDPAVLTGMGLTREADRQRFLTELMPRYRECARLRPVTTHATFSKDGVLTFERTLPYNAALFVTVAPEPELKVVRTTAGTELRGTTLLIHPEELTETWIDRAAGLGATTLSLHPWGGGWAVRSLEDLLDRCRRPEFRRLVDLAWEKGLRVEYEAHVGSWLLPRELFAQHPEYFRVDASGARTNRFNFCVSNAAAMDIVAARTRQLAASLYRSNPRYFLWLDDAHNTECHCAACKAYSASDQQLIVLNRLLGVLRETEPEAQLAYLAYFNTMKPPTKVRPAEGIFLEYAPIERVWDKPLTEQPKAVRSDELDALLNLFGRRNARVLEYWYDNSLFSKWTKPEKRFAVNRAVMERDVAWYQAKGFGEIASFACYLGPGYEKQWGAPDLTSFRRNSELAFKGLWSSTGGRDETVVRVKFDGDGLRFSFRVKDSTPTRIDTFRGEGDVGAVDRVELYLSPTPDLSRTYHCLEMSPQGHVLDYAADTFRQFRTDWNCRTLKLTCRYTADGYEVSGTILAEELKTMGLTRSNLHLGIYRADFAPDGKLVSWLSALPITAAPDFHRPGTLFPF